MNRRAFLKAIGVSALFGVLGFRSTTASAMPLEAKYKMLHKHGGNPCGKTAFYLTRKPNPLDVAASKDVILIGGKKPNQGSRVLCGTCGGYVVPCTDDIEDLT